MRQGCKGRGNNNVLVVVQMKKHLKEGKMRVKEASPTYLHIQIAGGTHQVGYTT
jgi:hypothetical protein